VGIPSARGTFWPGGMGAVTAGHVTTQVRRISHTPSDAPDESFKTLEKMAGVKGKGGKPGRSGRKSKAEEMGLQALLNRCWTLTDRQNCIAALARKAETGDIEATKLLMAYTYGKPKEQITIDGDLTATIVRLPVKQTQDEWQQGQSNNE